MGRAKLPIKLISPERSRNATFTKRRKGLKKKMFEFSTLCDVDACLIVYGSAPGAIPETWPEDPAEVHRIIDRFEKAPKEERDKRNQDVSSFLHSKNKKLQDEVEKMKRENEVLASMLLSNRSSLEAMGLDAIRELESRLNSKINEVNQRLACGKKEDMQEYHGGQLEPSIEAPTSYFQCLQGIEHRQVADYVTPLQSCPPSTPITHSLGSHGHNLVGFNGQDYSIGESSTCIAGPGCYYSDPITGFGCCCGTQEVMPFITDGTILDLKSKHVPANFSCGPPMRPCSLPPFHFPFQEDLDPLLSLMDQTAFNGFDEQGY